MEYSIVCVPSISSQVSSDNKPFIVATSRVPHLETFLNEGKLTVVHSGLRGADLAACGLEYYQPFSGEWNPMIHADFVSDSSGSGLVHLAPGHGMDDYNACTKLGIDAFAPVDDEGRYTAAAFPSDSNLLEGLSVQKEGVDAVLNYLGDQNRLFAVHKITHKYPIDWRTKEPVIIRATKQWFANVDGIKDDVLRALQNVTFIPESGRTRLESFVQGRSQWCISRQRAWGVPIPALYRVGQNGEADAIVDSDTIQHIIDVIKRDGIDSWWSDPEDDSKWVPSRFEGQFVRGSETMDVWFDSGTSWTLLPERNDKPVADVYLEGTDQHRGWFQSSLLTHVATKDTPANSEIKAPFDTLITHGFTLDSDGRKMSKSLGNVISPGQIMEGTLLPPQKMKKVAKHDAMGADALRLWVASSDYTRDVAIGEPVLKAVQTNLHKYRVTFKWILGILSLPKCPPPFPDFQTNKSLLQETSSGPLIDKIILTRLSQVSTKVRALYSAYEFSRGTSIVNTFIFNDLSAFYFETLKDRIYTGSLEDCKTAQEVLGVIFYELLQMLAPICPLLVEEVWDHLPQSLRESSVHPAKIIWTPFTVPYDVELIERQASTIQHLSASIKHCQETLRQDKKIGSGLETDVLLGIPDKISHPADLQLFFGPNGPHDEAAKQAAEEQLAAIFVVSSVKIMSPEQVIARSEGMKDTGDSVRSSYGPEDIHSLEIVEVVVQKAEKCKCPRCWRFVAEEPEQLCRRCGDVVP
jgi:isoleucyl-tRNA synthetase